MVQFAGLAVTPLRVDEVDETSSRRGVLRSRKGMMMRSSAAVVFTVALGCVVALGYYKGASDYAPGLPDNSGNGDGGDSSEIGGMTAVWTSHSRVTQEQIEEDKSLALPRHTYSVTIDQDEFRTCDRALNAVKKDIWMPEQERLRGTGGVVPAGLEGDDDVDVAIIVNAAIVAYTFIKKNEPVLDLKYNFANAIPEGIPMEKQYLVSGWDDPQTQYYSFKADNRAYLEVVSVDYMLMYQSGGSYKGVGKYLNHVSIVPCKVWVAWGTELQAKVVSHDILNIGSKEAPVAAMTMDIEFVVSTWTLTQSFVESFYVTGDGTFKKLT